MVTPAKGEPGSCVDCEPGLKRPIVSGVTKPRCSTHTREEEKRKRVRARETRHASTYGLAPGEYESLLAWQGGKCYICQRATGQTKALAVDHDHACCPGGTSCGECVRGLLCGPCNRDVIGRLGPEALRRAAAYQETPPARLWRAGLPPVVITWRRLHTQQPAP